MRRAALLRYILEVCVFARVPFELAALSTILEPLPKRGDPPSHARPLLLLLVIPQSYPTRMDLQPSGGISSPLAPWAERGENPTGVFPSACLCATSFVAANCTVALSRHPLSSQWPGAATREGILTRGRSFDNKPHPSNPVETGVELPKSRESLPSFVRERGAY